MDRDTAKQMAKVLVAKIGYYGTYVLAFYLFGLLTTWGLTDSDDLTGRILLWMVGIWLACIWDSLSKRGIAKKDSSDKGLLWVLRNDYMFTESAALNILTWTNALLRGIFMGLSYAGAAGFVMTFFSYHKITHFSIPSWYYFAATSIVCVTGFLVAVLSRLFLEAEALRIRERQAVIKYFTESYRRITE